MQERIYAVFRNIRDKWQGFDKKTRLIVIGVTIATFVALGVTVYLTTRPNFVVLVDNISLEDANSIKTALDDAGIVNKPVGDGTTIQVNSKDVTAAKLELAAQGIPKSGFSYADAISSSSMSTTSDIRREGMIRAKQSELEEGLKMGYSINNCTVELVLPDKDTFFIQTEQEASASVLLELRQELTPRQYEGMARYVAGAVKDLDIKNVVILDTQFNILYSGMQNEENIVGTQLETEAVLKKTMEETVRDILKPLYDDIRIVSQLKFNWDKEAQTSEIYDPPIEGSSSGAISHELLEQSKVTGSSTAAEPGVIPNAAEQPQYDTGDGSTGSAEVKRSDRDFLFNKTTSTTEYSVGQLLPQESSISIHVGINKHYHEEVVQAQGLLEEISWEDYKTQIRSQQVPLIIPQDIIDSLKIGTQIENLALIGYETPIFHDKLVVQRPIDQYVAVGILAILIALLAFSLIRRTEPEDVTDMEPELSVEELLVTSQEEKDAERLMEDVDEIEFFMDSEVKKQIDKFIDEKPEAAAALLRNWLNDEWE